VNLEVSFLNQAGWEVHLDKELLQKIYTALKKASSIVKVTPEISAESLFKIPGIIEIQKKNLNKEEAAFLQECFEKTLDEVIRQRKREGRELERAIRKHLRNIKSILKKIERLAVAQPLLIQNRMKDRLAELTKSMSLQEDKLIEEAGYFAQKYDLSEEIERLQSHVTYIEELLYPGRDEPAGRKVDFIIQELYREINTVGSKAQDIEIIKSSVAFKSELESIRQQVQNIE